MLSGLLPYCLEFSMPYAPLNQVHPGPLEGIDRIPGDATQARTGNTEREQETWFAGVEEGQRRAEHNAAVRSAWMPIESAPKDGTEILAWRHDCGQFIASYTSADAFPMTQDELDAMDEETLFAKDWFTQWPDATRLDGSEAPTHWQPLPAAPSPASVAPGDAQDDRLYQWPTTTARMKALAAELIFAANSMGGGGNDGEDVELVLSVAPAGTILLDEDPDVWNPGSLLTVHTKEYPDAGRYLVDPAQVSSDGTQCPAPTAGEAPPRFTISASDRFELTGAVGLLRGYGCAGAADALQRVLDDEMASFSVQGEDAVGDARDAARYRVVRMVAADKENGYALMAEASREVGIEVGRYPTPEQFDAVVDLLAAQQGKGGEK
ncbi:hypothetical protein [Bordetella bronchiseptica]|uniref:hypothetical protein n=1 Tax=Bordetella bronchiseptica TaxID=518 RepID=UPI00045A6286|nr:hypothetical protein [Bordetella bronchiseptica]KAK54008.1 hypothetical protein L576_2319 [Bordetella bronchiseptica OSU054]